MLPASIVLRGGFVRLLIDPIGGATPHLTAPIMVSAGEEVRLRVQNHLALSNVIVTVAEHR